MKILSFLLAMVLACTSCARRVEVVTPGHTLLVNDRIHDIVMSAMDNEAKLRAIQMVLEREKDRGSNITATVRELLTIIAAAAAVAK